MDSAGNKRDDPAGSLLNVFGGFFARDPPPSKDAEAAVLTSFKALPDGDGPEAAASLETGQDSGQQGSAGAPTDLDLVQVTRVETYSDTEEEEASRGAGASVLPEEDDLPDGAELNTVPVFRTHKFTERSRLEEILCSGGFVSRRSSRTSRVSLLSLRGSAVEEDTERDGSQPVPSIFPAPSATPALDDTPKEDTAKPGSGKHESLSSSVPSGPKTDASVRSSSTPDSADVTHSGRDRATSPSGDLQPSVSPSPQRTTPAKTPEADTPPPEPPVLPSPVSSSPSRATAPAPPASFQMPALFSGLRVLKKGAVGEDRETVSEIKQREKDADLALLSLKTTVNKAKLLPEHRTTAPVKKQAEPKPTMEPRSDVMGRDQDEGGMSHGGQDGKKESEVPGDRCPAPDEGKSSELTSPGPETPASTPQRKKTSDMAYETFKNLFGPKTVKKERADDVDLEMVKKKIKNDKESLRMIFERASKTPSKDLKSPTEPSVRTRRTRCLLVTMAARLH